MPFKVRVGESSILVKSCRYVLYSVLSHCIDVVYTFLLIFFVCLFVCVCTGFQVQSQFAQVCTSVWYCSNSRANNSSVSPGGAGDHHRGLPGVLHIFLLLHSSLLKT